ncbi:hypothetical protein COT72_05170 [archaeon CG10_big_fil_rev_8_21_14_0_10_43_11]|nr:MAG: hypothetical protein COT72_05170 [archaeon CG10_big_fil_rev_8_21_14_0_10_43_11]
MVSIVPGIIAKNQKELDGALKKVMHLVDAIQLDVMDGAFVLETSLDFDFSLPNFKGSYEAHLMVANPHAWIKKHAHKVDAIIFHIESTKNPKKLIKEIQDADRCVSVAINPKTPVSAIEPLLDTVESVLVMSVEPGRYGSEFLQETVDKVNYLQTHYPDVPVEVDGGITPYTIVNEYFAGADSFVSGSYVMHNTNTKKAIETLKDVIEHAKGKITYPGFSFSYRNSMVSSGVFESGQKKLHKTVQAFRRDLETKTETRLNYIDNKKMLADVKRIAQHLKKDAPDYLVIVGIGGSSLGTRAIHEALNGALYNESRKKPKVFFLETVDSEYTHDVFQILKRNIKRGKKVVINTISKSGLTAETIANFQAVVELVKEFDTSYASRVVVTTTKNSPLWRVAKKQGYHTLAIPLAAGGRFSVFSPVGLFPLLMLEIDIDKLLEGARAMRDLCVHEEWQSNPAIVSAIVHSYYYNRKKRIANIYLFSGYLKSVGDWWRQLISESLGKQGRGFTPIVSVGSIDNHSMFQLFAGGPKDKITTFVNVKYVTRGVRVPKLFGLVKELETKRYHTVLGAILAGTETSFEKKDLPFLSVELEVIDEENIGAFLMFKMLEVMYLGKLLGVNAFDQPNVESYKKETRKNL